MAPWSKMALSRLGVEDAEEDEEDGDSLTALEVSANLNRGKIGFGMEEGQRLKVEWCELAAAGDHCLNLNSALCSIDLSGNVISEENARKVAAFLEGNETLTELVLSGSDIGDRGVKDIAESLANNKGLRMLCLSFNKINEEAGSALCNMLIKNDVLEFLDLKGNTLSNGARELASALDINKTLQILNLSNNRVGSAAIDALSAGLRNNTSLTTIYLESNGIRDSGIMALVELIKVNNTLRNLYLNGNLFLIETAALLGSWTSFKQVKCQFHSQIDSRVQSAEEMGRMARWLDQDPCHLPLSLLEFDNERDASFTRNYFQDILGIQLVRASLFSHYSVHALDVVLEWVQDLPLKVKSNFSFRRKRKVN